ncbi:hypothetical protein KCP78_14230 [Salmonella enterica subsp. enterica]|nr:hypothetical protein KCP78_14230 [Salmonella enterica subsp. enterica]
MLYSLAEKYKSAPHTLNTVQQHQYLAMNYACLWQKPRQWKPLHGNEIRRRQASTQEYAQ